MSTTRIFKRGLDLLGLVANTTSHTEKLVSGLGAVAGIYAVWWVSGLFIDAHDAPLIIAAMGSSAVLLFAVPHAQLSQPWNLCAGHILSAIAGVACATAIPGQGLAAAAAVSLAIVLMHYTQSIHPPGGATALTAVVGGPGIHHLGFTFVILPVAINVLVILLAAIIFNYPFKWRRYPEAIMPKKTCGQEHLMHQDIQYALQQSDALLDVTEHELEQLFTLAEKHASDDHLAVRNILSGHYYSNGKLGSEWSVRHLTDDGPGDRANENDQLAYKVVAGNLQHKTGSISRIEMARWARYEVEPNDARHHGWRKVAADE